MNYEPLINVSRGGDAPRDDVGGFDVAVLQQVSEKFPLGEPRLTDNKWNSLVNLVSAPTIMPMEMKAGGAMLTNLRENNRWDASREDFSGDVYEVAVAQSHVRATIAEAAK